MSISEDMPSSAHVLGLIKERLRNELKTREEQGSNGEQTDEIAARIQLKSSKINALTTTDLKFDETLSLFFSKYPWTQNEYNKDAGTHLTQTLAFQFLFEYVVLYLEFADEDDPDLHDQLEIKLKSLLDNGVIDVLQKNKALHYGHQQLSSVLGDTKLKEINTGKISFALTGLDVYRVLAKHTVLSNDFLNISTRHIALEDARADLRANNPNISPYWVAIDHDSKIIYGLENEKLSEKLIALGYSYQPISMTRISDADYQLLDRFGLKDDLERWHAMLLAQVYPTLLKTLDVKKHCNTVPFSLVLEEAIHTLDEKQQRTVKLFDRFKIYPPIAPDPDKIAAFQKGNFEIYPASKWLTLVDNGAIKYNWNEASQCYNGLKVQDPFFTATDKQHHHLGALVSQVISHKLSSLTLSFKSRNIAFSSFFSNKLNYDLDLLKHDENLVELNVEECPVGYAKHFRLPAEYVARNRWLISEASETERKKYKTVSERWQLLGKTMVSYFQRDAAELFQVFENNEQSQDNQLNTRYNYITKLGQSGIEHLFAQLKVEFTEKWSNEDEAPAPRLSFLFDTRGSDYSDPNENIINLKKHIEKFGRKKTQNWLRMEREEETFCSPLFRNFGIVLPKHGLKVELLNELIETLNTRKVKYPNEAREIVLYDHKLEIDVYKKLLYPLLEKIKNDPTWALMIRIPSLDRLKSEYEDYAQNDVLKAYVTLQNLIEKNIGSKNNEYLRTQVDPLINQASTVKQKIAQKNTSKRDFYVLKIELQAQFEQQQQQQQQQQEQQEEQKEEQKEEKKEEKKEKQQQQNLTKKKKKNIRKYPDIQEEICVRRENSGWNIPQQYKPKLEYQELQSMLNHAFGKQFDRTNGINFLTISALKKMEEFHDSFREGMPSNTAGFYFAEDSTGKRILCWDEDEEMRDIHINQSTAFSEAEKDLFFVILDHKKERQPFRGDPNQFSWSTSRSKVDDVEHMNHFWREYASADSGTMLLKPALHHEQPFPLIATLEKIFAKHGVSLSSENKKSFGQILQRYNPKNEKGAGAKIFFELITLVESTHYFKSWKRAILDCTDDWATLLELEEVEPLLDSIHWFQNHPSNFAEIWWKLLETESQYSQSMHYSRLWPAFKQVMEYIIELNLSITPEQVITLIETNKEQFNSKLFLQRLSFCLYEATKTTHTEKIQANIIKNLQFIDWGPQGFAYAVEHYHYRYWHSSLQLNDNTDLKFYETAWNDVQPGEHQKMLTMRFASQQMQYDIEDFEKLALGLQAIPDVSPLLCFLRSSLLKGSDQLNELQCLNDPTWQQAAANVAPENDYLRIINRLAWSEEGPEVPILHLRLQYLPKIIMLLEEVQFDKNKVKIPLLNALMRAVIISEEKHIPYENLINFTTLAAENAGNSIITTYPWLPLLEKKIDDPFERAKQQILTDLQNAEQLKKEEQAKGNVFQRFWGQTTQAIAQGYEAIAGKSEIFSKVQIDECFSLTEKMQLIDLKQKEYPSYEELQTHYQHILTSKAPKEAKNECIRLIKTKYILNDNTSAFHPLPESNSVIRDILPAFIKNKQRPTYQKENNALITYFFKTYVAIQDTPDSKTQCQPLLDLFQKLDNKNHFNELGYLLSILISTARRRSNGDQIALYSIHQLAHWVRCLVNEKTINSHHFPFESLESILNANPKTSSLLNTDLQQLDKDCAPIQLYHLIHELNDRPDIAKKYKKDLITLILRFKDQPEYNSDLDRIKQLLAKNKPSLFWDRWVASLINHWHVGIPVTSLINFGENVSNTNAYLRIDPHLSRQWENISSHLIEKFATNGLKDGQIDNFLDLETIRGISPKIKIILSETISNWNSVERNQIELLIQHLSRFSQDDLNTLSAYYQNKPCPTLEALNESIESSRKMHGQTHLTANMVIDYFESIIRAGNKRDYSLTCSVRDLERIIKMRFKEEEGENAYLTEHEQNRLINLFYHANDFSINERLDQLDFKNLQKKLHDLAYEVRNGSNDDYTRAEILACMREIALRKTGIWMNHTQMLDLIYLVCHDEDGAILQFPTGAGKSIISSVYSSYYALCGSGKGFGDIIALGSSNESLSLRDYLEFLPLIQQGFGIRCSHVTPDSPLETYQQIPSEGIGALNFITIDTVGLFALNHGWQGKFPFSTNKEEDKLFKHRYFGDEIDYQVLSHQTQLNSSEEAKSLYNLDEWAYRDVYEYYLEHCLKENNHHLIQDGELRIYEGAQEGGSGYPNLMDLLFKLKASSQLAPEGSPFLQKIRNANEEELHKELIKMLSAAHNARALKENIHYCVVDEKKELADGSTIPVKSAKVLIDNQLHPGTTYSQLVQQFLYIKLKREALEKNEIPAYYVVEPETFITGSFSVPHILKRFFDVVGGCSATLGNQLELQTYKKLLKTKRFLKVARHVESNSIFLPSIYANDHNHLIESVVTSVENTGDRPVLILCENEAEVKQLYKELQNRFPNHRLIEDLSSTRSMQQTVALAGQSNVITISARLERGANIYTDHPQGLHVIYTNVNAVTIPIKQGLGRQARGEQTEGSNQIIIDYSVIAKDYQALIEAGGTKAERIQAIYDEEKTHLEQKIRKHLELKSEKKKFKEKWIQMNEDPLSQKKYLEVRTMALFKQEQQIEQSQWDNRSKYLFSMMTEEFCLIKPRIKNLDYQKFDNLFSAFRADYVKAWVEYRKGKSDYDQVAYESFIQYIEKRWKTWQAEVTPLLRQPSEEKSFSTFEQLLQETEEIYQARHPDPKQFPRYRKIPPKIPVNQVIKHAIPFYQAWTAQVPRKHYRYTSKEQTNFYKNINNLEYESDDLQECFMILNDWTQTQKIYHISLRGLSQILNLLKKPRQYEYFKNGLPLIFEYLQYSNPSQKHFMEETFILGIQSIIKYDKSVEQMKLLMAKIQQTIEHFGPSFDAQHVHALDLLADDPKRLMLFLDERFSQEDLAYLLGFIQKTPQEQYQKSCQDLLNLVNYLANYLNKNLLLQKPSAIPFVSQLRMRDAESLDAEFRDNPMLLLDMYQRRDANHKNRTIMMDLLSTRLFSKGEFERFIQSTSAADWQERMSHLKQFPPYIHLNEIQHTPTPDLPKLKKAADDFNQFLQSKLGNAYITKHQEACKNYYAVFDRIPLAEKSFFFDAIRQSNLDLSEKSIRLIADVCLKNPELFEDNVKNLLKIYQAASAIQMENKNLTGHHQVINMISMVDHKLEDISVNKRKLNRVIDIHQILIKAIPNHPRISSSSPIPDALLNYALDDGQSLPDRLAFSNRLGYDEGGNPFLAFARLLYTEPSPFEDSSERVLLLNTVLNSYVAAFEETLMFEHGEHNQAHHLEERLFNARRRITILNELRKIFRGRMFIDVAQEELARIRKSPSITESTQTLRHLELQEIDQIKELISILNTKQRHYEVVPMSSLTEANKAKAEPAKIYFNAQDKTYIVRNLEEGIVYEGTYTGQIPPQLDNLHFKKDLMTEASKLGYIPRYARPVPSPLEPSEADLLKNLNAFLHRFARENYKIEFKASLPTIERAEIGKIYMNSSVPGEYLFRDLAGSIHQGQFSKNIVAQFNEHDVKTIILQELADRVLRQQDYQLQPMTLLTEPKTDHVKAGTVYFDELSGNCLVCDFNQSIHQVNLPTRDLNALATEKQNKLEHEFKQIVKETIFLKLGIPNLLELSSREAFGQKFIDWKRKEKQKYIKLGTLLFEKGLFKHAQDANAEWKTVLKTQNEEKHDGDHKPKK